MSIRQVDQGASGHFEAEVSRTFLPRCVKCHSAHPLAIKSLSDKSKCPVCGTPSGEPGETLVDVGALGFSPAILAGRALLATGRFLGKLIGES